MLTRRTALAVLTAALAAPAWGLEAMTAKIISPVPNRVFQRDSAGNADLRVSWAGAADTVRLKSGSTVIQTSARGEFWGVPAGWYTAVLVSGGIEGDSIPIGVGDVFVVAGQSNAVSPLQPLSFMPPVPAAGRVIVSDYYRFGSHVFRDCGVDPLHSTGPTDYVGGVAWLYCGITMNRSFPLMFVNVAVGNTTTTQWVNGLLVRVYEAWAIYKPKAILWHQGESDANLAIPEATSYANMDACIQSLREITTVPWVIARNSGYPLYAGIRNAQQNIIAKWSAKTPQIVFMGPDTDTVRNGDAEFMGADIAAFGNLWGSTLVSQGF